MNEDSQVDSAQIQYWLDRIKAGDQGARNELIRQSCERMRRLTRRMLRIHYPDVHRWEQTDDVLQNALVRLHRSLETVHPESARRFIGLAATVIRCELIDLARHHFGPGGDAAHHLSGSIVRSDNKSDPGREAIKPAKTDEPLTLEDWTEFHETVEKLPEKEKEIIDLLFYQGLSQKDAAIVLDISERGVKRLWQSARLNLHRRLKGEMA